MFTESPETVLQKLVDIAVEYCGADSSGISLEEMGEDGKLRFRWVAISGSFAQYINGCTPRFFSPCGTCLVVEPVAALSRHQAVLRFSGRDGGADHRRAFDSVENRRAERNDLGHLARLARTFAPNDYALLTALADFAGVAIRLHADASRLAQSAADLQRSHDSLAMQVEERTTFAAPTFH